MSIFYRNEIWFELLFGFLSLFLPHCGCGCVCVCMQAGLRRERGRMWECNKFTCFIWILSFCVALSLFWSLRSFSSNPPPLPWLFPPTGRIGVACERGHLQTLRYLPTYPVQQLRDQFSSALWLPFQPYLRWRRGRWQPAQAQFRQFLHKSREELSFPCDVLLQHMVCRFHSVLCPGMLLEITFPPQLNCMMQNFCLVSLVKLLKSISG